MAGLQPRLDLLWQSPSHPPSDIPPKSTASGPPSPQHPGPGPSLCFWEVVVSARPPVHLFPPEMGEGARTSWLCCPPDVLPAARQPGPIPRFSPGRTSPRPPEGLLANGRTWSRGPGADRGQSGQGQALDQARVPRPAQKRGRGRVHPDLGRTGPELRIRNPHGRGDVRRPLSRPPPFSQSLALLWLLSPITSKRPGS